MANEERMEELKDQLINVLEEMDKIMPVQFHDVDCDDCVFNFSGVRMDKTDNRIYVELAMWHDNLPSHFTNPLKDSRGQEIRPSYVDSTYADHITEVRLVKFNSEGRREYTDVAKETTKGGLVSMLVAYLLPTIECNAGEQVCISFFKDEQEYFVTVVNKTSDVAEEWCCFDYSDEVISRSVLDCIDYSMDYNDARLKAEEDGKTLSQHEFFTCEEDRSREIITNVRIGLFNCNADSESYTNIADSTTKCELINMFKSGVVSKVASNECEEVYIMFEAGGETRLIGVGNKTSDVEEEWIDYDYSDEIVTMSILNEVDYCMDYNDRRLKAEKNGITLSRQDYFREKASELYN